MQFRHPLQQEDFQVIEGIEQLKRLVQKEQNIHAKYYFRINRNKYLYSKCNVSQCPAILKYKLNQESERFVLKQFNNNHFHRFSTNRNNKILSNFIKDLPDTIDQKTAKYLVQNELNQKASRFYYFYKKIKQTTSSLKEALQFLDRKGYQIHVKYLDDEEKIPQLIFVTNDRMKYLFNKYSQWMSYDMTYNLIRTDNSYLYKVGVFASISFSKRICPFAYTIALDEKKNTYVDIFKTFHRVMNKFPQIITTDEAISIQQALIEINSQGQFRTFHCLDLFHILKNVKKKLSVKQNVTEFSKLAFSYTEPEFERQLQRCYNKISIEDVPILQRFVKNSAKYCLYEMPNLLIGWSTTTGINEKVNDILKRYMPIQKPLGYVLRKCSEVLEKIIEVSQEFKIERIPVEQFFQLHELKQIRFKLDRSVFKKFCQNLSKIISCEMIESENQNWTKIHDHTINSQFLIRSYPEQKPFYRYQCSCNLAHKTGLLCQHLLKFYIVQKIRLAHGINERWLITRDEKKKKRNLGRGKDSRRNRL